MVDIEKLRNKLQATISLQDWGSFDKIIDEIAKRRFLLSESGDYVEVIYTNDEKSLMIIITEKGDVEVIDLMDLADKILKIRAMLTDDEDKHILEYLWLITRLLAYDLPFPNVS